MDGLATYTDIKYKLTIWDVLDLIEIFIVKGSNKLRNSDKERDSLEESKHNRR